MVKCSKKLCKCLVIGREKLLRTVLTHLEFEWIKNRRDEFGDLIRRTELQVVILRLGEGAYAVGVHVFEPAWPTTCGLSTCVTHHPPSEMRCSLFPSLLFLLHPPKNLHIKSFYFKKNKRLGVRKTRELLLCAGSTTDGPCVVLEAECKANSLLALLSLWFKIFGFLIESLLWSLGFCGHMLGIL